MAPHDPQQQSVSSEATVNSVLRALDVLSYFAETNQPSLGVTELAEAVGLSKTIVYRILSSLRARDFVHIDHTTHRYSLGPKALALAEAYRRQIDVGGIARDEMVQLVRETGETATLSLRVGCTRMYIDQVTPDRDVKMMVQIGHTYPLHAGSSSKAFLAFLSPDQVEHCISGELDQLTPQTITSRSVLEADLETVRAKGYATSLGERDPGAGSVAAPVFEQGSAEPAAVISVCGPLERFRRELDVIAPLLVAASHRVSHRLGHVPTSTAG